MTRTRFTYTLNQLGLRTAVSETLDTSTRSVSYAYDGLLRLTDASESGATTNTYAYGYDLAGNRTSATVNGVTTTRGYNAANQVTGWSYDAAGNLLNDGTTTSTYDALNRLTNSTDGSASRLYQYNGDGVLVAQTSGGSTTTYAQDLVAPLSQVLETNSVPIFYGHERLALPTSSTLIWFLHDGLGSVRQTLDGSGGAPNSVSYDPWGVPQGGLPLTLSGMGFGFTGELQNSASGLVHLRARWYDANAGRFHARDPFEGWAETPYSQHFYQYAYSNPVNWTDPTGRCVPGLTPDCRPVWEIGQGPNWQDFGSYWGTVATTTAEIVASPVLLLYNATTAEGRATIARGAQVLVTDPLGSARTLWETQFDSLRDVARGFECGDEELIARGLVGTGFTLWGARGFGKTSPGRWLSGNEGQIRSRVAGIADDNLYLPLKGLGNGTVIEVNPAELRWTQRTAGGRGRAETLRQSMAERGYAGDPIDVVNTADGLVTVDHTRAAVALELGIDRIPARVHLPDEPLPADMVGRFGPARTWGEAATYRAANQRPPLPATGTSNPPRLPPKEQR